jgi:hypothetical protein
MFRYIYYREMEQLFENKKLNVSVRTVEDRGRVFLCAKDVAGSKTLSGTMFGTKIR